VHGAFITIEMKQNAAEEAQQPDSLLQPIDWSHWQSTVTAASPTCIQAPGTVEKPYFLDFQTLPFKLKDVSTSKGFVSGGTIVHTMVQPDIAVVSDSCSGI
jgi:hypothetical protein